MGLVKDHAGADFKALEILVCNASLILLRYQFPHKFCDGVAWISFP